MPKASNSSTKKTTVAPSKGANKTPARHVIKVSHLLKKADKAQPLSNEIAAQMANAIAEVIHAEAPFGSFLIGHPNFDFCLLALTESFESLKADSYISLNDYSAAADFKLLTSQLANWARDENISLGNIAT